MAVGVGSHKYVALDGLRGLAALIVVFCHYANGFFPAAVGISTQQHVALESKLATLPAYLLVAGNFAVCTFFVLSAFVLSAKFFSTRDFEAAQRSVAKAALKRYFRLAIPVTTAVLLSLGLLAMGAYRNTQTAAITGSQAWLGIFWGNHASLAAALKEGLYATFAHAPSAVASLDSSLWTMRIEFLGSLLLFGFLLIAGRLALRWVVYIVLMAVFSHSYYLGFVFGIMLSDLWHSPHTIKQVIPTKLGWPLLLIGLTLGSWVYIGPQVHTWTSGLSLPGFDADQLSVFARTVGAGCLVFAVLLLEPIGAFFSLRPLRFLGRISFSMYLIHILVLGSFSCYLFNSLLISHSYLLSFAVMFAASLVVVLISASIFEQVVDVNAVKFSNRVGNVLIGEAGARGRFYPGTIFRLRQFYAYASRITIW